MGEGGACYGEGGTGLCIESFSDEGKEDKEGAGFDEDAVKVST